MDGIRIHPAGSQVADAEKAAVMATSHPAAFRLAQDLLVAAKKFREGKGGIFSSRRSRIRKLQQLVYELRDALTESNYSQVRSEKSQATILFAYLSEFSDAFPNWQPEYETLNSFIPKCL